MSCFGQPKKEKGVKFRGGANFEVVGKSKPTFPIDVH